MGLLIDVEKNKATVFALLGGAQRDHSKLSAFLKESDFFTAPASTSFHLSVPGGLVQHSLNFIEALHLLNDKFDAKLSHESINFVGVCHDLCKVGLYKKNAGYKQYFKDETLPLGHGEKSLFIANKLVDLSHAEALMIRWHMGLWPQDNFFKESTDISRLYPGTHLAYFADHLATLYLDTKYV